MEKKCKKAKWLSGEAFQIAVKRSNGLDSEQELGAGDGQGSLACCSPWGHKESDVAE